MRTWQACMIILFDDRQDLQIRNCKLNITALFYIKISSITVAYTVLYNSWSLSIIFQEMSHKGSVAPSPATAVNEPAQVYPYPPPMQNPGTYPQPAQQGNYSTPGYPPAQPQSSANGNLGAADNFQLPPDGKELWCCE